MTSNEKTLLSDSLLVENLRELYLESIKGPIYEIDKGIKPEEKINFPLYVLSDADKNEPTKIASWLGYLIQYMYNDNRDYDLSEVGTLVLSILELLVPKCGVQLVNRLENYVVELVVLTDAHWNFINNNVPFQPNSDDLTKYQEMEDHSSDKKRTYDIAIYRLFRHLKSMVHFELNTAYTVRDYTIAFSSLILALGKEPTSHNVASFGDPRVNFKLQPTLTALRKVHFFFTAYSNLRIELSQELISWCSHPAPSEAIEIVGPKIKIWDGIGLTHVTIISDMLRDCRPYFDRYPHFKCEIGYFDYGLEELNKKIEIYDKYYKVIFGDRAREILSKKVPELLKLAKVYASRKNPRFKRYAPQLGYSVFEQSFRQYLRNKSQHE
ncbi:hypothetical protein A0J61_01289 [Choanephora cucurbitarum]|uniref:Uncharacterized protein n=1 Tax=Choanephora cucurbitarum TaxID=101091 RepID=A0A1C7NNI4_9FUNG|nr:hypothetical protein A0J61_01289 [Choanephora cucurbitarum]